MITFIQVGRCWTLDVRLASSRVTKVQRRPLGCPLGSHGQSKMGSLCGKMKDEPAMTAPVPLTATPAAVEVNPRRRSHKRASSEMSRRRSLPDPGKLAREKANPPQPRNLATITSESESYLDKHAANSENKELKWEEIQLKENS